MSNREGVGGLAEAEAGSGSRMFAKEAEVKAVKTSSMEAESVEA